jgi:D-alanyl-D-alanine dipeptidase
LVAATAAATVAFAATSGAAGAAPPRAGRLVDVARLDATIRIEMRYAGTDNFLRRRLYDAPRCLLRPDAARRLIRVQARLAERGLGLKVWDAYRPYRVQFLMWKAVPDERYVADPRKGSLHNRGAAVDVTLVDAAGRELDMGSAHDDFSERAHPDAAGISRDARRSRRILRDAMAAEGFEQLRTEWWHFNAPGAARHPLLDVPLSRATE